MVWTISKGLANAVQNFLKYNYEDKEGFMKHSSVNGGPPLQHNIPFPLPIGYLKSNILYAI